MSVPVTDSSGEGAPGAIAASTAIASATGFYQGYGFAIPINLARRIMEDLIEFGAVRRARLGVIIEDVAPEDAEAFGLPSVAGVLIQGVDEEGPAAGEDLQQGDVIVEVEGEPVGYVAQLQGKVAMRRPGDRIQLTIYRDGAPRNVTMRLGEAPLNETTPTVVAAEPMAEERLGIMVEPMTRELADRYNRVIVEDLAALGLSYDLFTPTTTGNHYQVVQELFETLHRLLRGVEGLLLHVHAGDRADFVFFKQHFGEVGVEWAEGDFDDDQDGYTENQGDCSDADASIHPGVEEICGDGIDQDDMIAFLGLFLIVINAAMLSLADFLVDFELSSLFRWAWTFRELRFSRYAVFDERFEGTRTRWTSLIADLAPPFGGLGRGLGLLEGDARDLDLLVGGNGNDRILGQAGNDRISGQRGRDILLGHRSKKNFR